jgi:hypothetical protein
VAVVEQPRRADHDEQETSDAAGCVSRRDPKDATGADAELVGELGWRRAAEAA